MTYPFEEVIKMETIKDEDGNDKIVWDYVDPKPESSKLTRDDITDRELLELAAKAMGIEVWWNGRTWFLLENKVATHEWNPLTDDGNALRLAVKLRFMVDVCDHRIMVVLSNSPDLGGFSAEVQGCVETVKNLNADHPAATRRAIVRAAAEIGRNMK